MYDYLAILKSLFGVKTPIGIMTTYDGWRFCRLKEGKLTEDRVFLATDEIKSNLHLHTISALLQMNNPEMDDVKITADTCFPHLSPGTFTFKALGQNENQLIDGFPGANSEYFYLLGHLGSGVEAKVWLACNNSYKKWRSRFGRRCSEWRSSTFLTLATLLRL